MGDDLEAIKAKRLAELQQQMGVSHIYQNDKDLVWYKCASWKMMSDNKGLHTLSNPKLRMVWDQ